MANASERWAEFKGQFVAWLAQGAKDFHSQIVPAFPNHNPVDQPFTPLNMPTEAANPDGVLYEPSSKPTFEETMGRSAPASPGQDRPLDRGPEL
jgi:hypothetical protein